MEELHRKKSWYTAFPLKKPPKPRPVPVPHFAHPFTPAHYRLWIINIEERIGRCIGRSQKASALARDEAALASVWADAPHVFSIHNEVLQNARSLRISPGSPTTCINNSAIAKRLQWKTLPRPVVRMRSANSTPFSPLPPPLLLACAAR